MQWWKIRNIFIDKWKEELNNENVLIRYRAKQFINILADAEKVEEFDVDMYFKLVEKMTMFDGKKIIVILINGTEIEFVVE